MEMKTADTLTTVDIDNGVLPAYSDIVLIQMERLEP